jgi:catechol 2,3-dioxygenase-like lactoylglutathione lyase family enzyme
MMTGLSHLTILVHDQQEAADFYTKKLGFKVHTDATFENSRWLTLCLPEQPNLELALVLAQGDDKNLVGKQGGTQTPLASFSTKDCKKTYEEFKKRGVEFLGEPTTEPWGIGVIFKDLYGNMFYLCQSA